MAFFKPLGTVVSLVIVVGEKIARWRMELKEDILSTLEILRHCFGNAAFMSSLFFFNIKQGQKQKRGFGAKSREKYVLLWVRMFVSVEEIPLSFCALVLQWEARGLTVVRVVNKPSYVLPC